MNNFTKKALVCASIMVVSSTALAYENQSAGFSVRDGKPETTMRAQNMYSFFDKSNNFHAVASYSSDDVKRLSGEEFNTNTFNDIYGKLALLERSDLNLQTIPMPLLDLKKYAADENNILGEIYNDKRDPELRIDKIGSHKVISYIYRHALADKENKESKDEGGICISMLSANDRLYILTSEQKLTEQPQPDDGEDSILRKDKKAAEVAAKKAELLSEAQKEGWQQHIRFIKGFKAFAAKGDTPAFGYYDKIAGKAVQLPDNWVNAQVNVDGNVSVNISAPIPMLRKMSATVKDEYDLNSAGNLKSMKAIGSIDPALLNSNAGLAQKLLSDFDKVLITASYKDENNDFASFREQPAMLQYEVETFLRETMQRLKNDSNIAFGRLGKDEVNSVYVRKIFQLKDYKYNVDMRKDKGLVDLWMNYDMYNDYNLNTQLKASYANNVGLLLIYTERSGEPTDSSITKSIDQWQF